jgi:hypothetical protein
VASVEELLDAWISAIPKRKAPAHLQAWCGEALVVETDHGDQAGSVLADQTRAAVEGAGKPLSFTVRAIDKQQNVVATFPLRVTPPPPTTPAKLPLDQGSAELPAVTVAFIMELMNQNKLLARTMIEAIGPLLHGAAEVVTAASLRAQYESARADEAMAAMRGAVAVADDAVKSAEQTAAAAAEKGKGKDGQRASMEKFVMAMAGKQLGMDPGTISLLMGADGVPGLPGAPPGSPGGPPAPVNGAA